ncbi:LOW QUALITY PROTEIN: chondroadherin-like protein [Liasis olivaceus]
MPFFSYFPNQLLPRRWASAGLLLISALLTESPVAECCPQICTCDSIEYRVICSNKNLTKVPFNIPQIIKKLALQDNEIAVIPLGTFLSIPYLTHLKFQRCKIKSIEEGALRGLGQLVYLNLASNYIAFIYQESLDGLFPLSTYLAHNHIEEIKPEVFGQLGFLSLLNLAKNSLVYLPDMVFQGLQMIKWINLSHNSLNVFANEAFGGLPTLRKLTLHHNELQFFPTEALSRLSGINQLDLGLNPITYTGEEAFGMAYLKQLYLDNMALQDPLLHTLDLHNNQLLVLQPPREMVHLKKINLTTLCTCHKRPLKKWADKPKINIYIVCAGPLAFRGEHLESLQATGMKCKHQTLEEDLPPTMVSRKLEEGAIKCPKECTCSLDYQHGKCDNKNLLSIPKGFSSNTQLLDYNEFHSIPDGSFLGLKNLTSFHLQNYKIKGLQPGAFQDLKTLIYLYLSNNDICSIDADVFRDITQLAYLLDHKKFTQMPKDAFSYLPNLFAFHLQHNSVSQLSDNALAGMKKLHVLTGNHIIHLSPRAVRQAKMLEKLHLDENSLQEILTKALRGLPILNELKLSKNPIKYIGRYLPIARSLQHLYLDNIGLEQISSGAFTGLGPNIKSLNLEENRIHNLPNLHGFTALEVINLNDVPFSCDC